ncbi:hypothetical protein [Methanoculleus receptaculi]|uniref:Uncharacterized protein n=1 Tax=Methanoculleus receptaculi TaxID=394967 RepID=A0AAX4FVI1_9EURY|nr:hypothetical protein [Methanoculleus receptaculi]WOX57820.1 hypothetical protein R6Y96_00770 [Methanoculleus receptaculi]
MSGKIIASLPRSRFSPLVPRSSPACCSRCIRDLGGYCENRLRVAPRRHHGRPPPHRGLDPLQVMAITAAFPFMLVMIGLCYTLAIGLSQEKVQ